jgi:amino acid adenylation domain-containing protein
MKDLTARRNLRVPDSFVEFRYTECEQPIHRRFEQQASRCPDSIAVRLLSSDITYAELNAVANTAARRLLHIIKDDYRPVALLLNQGYESIVWTLAILKAGRCYAPLDQRLPESVLRGMLNHLDPAAVVADIRYREVAFGAPVIDAVAEHEQLPSENLDRSDAANAIAYIFYTSGSTGAPKAVADCHRNVLHNVMRYTNSLRFSPGDILSLVQNPGFSGTVSSLFGALTNGAAIAPFDPQSEGLTTLSEWLKRARVTVFHAVPSIFRQLADPVTRFPEVRLVRLEGDRMSALDVEHFRASFSETCTLVNGLGATECGLVRQFFIGRNAAYAGGPVPIGYAVPGVKAFVEDEGGAPLPAGSTGEIVVESEYLAVGYWNNPALTEERFVVTSGCPRRYRTGDLGRMDEDGCLTLLGRVDQRIRIRGEFVDASEIEKQMLAVTGVRECIVRDFEDRFGERRLCAYLIADPDVTVTRLRDTLSEQLAEPFAPAAFVFLESFPLTNDRKIDYHRLPPPSRQRPRLTNDYVSPETSLEQQLAVIWSEVLEIDCVGVTDSLFDLGGDSLQTTRIASRIEAKYGLPVSVANMFRLQTIRAVALLLDSPNNWS